MLNRVWNIQVKYIDSVHKQTTAIDEAKDDYIQFAIKNNILVIDNPANSPIQSEIYSLDGTLAKKNCATNTIDISDLCNGVYVVKIISNKNTITRKIWKKWNNIFLLKAGSR